MLMLCRAPLYPPKSVSFEVGFSLNHMQPVPGRYQVQLTDHMQTFQLPASTSMGHFFKIILHGKVQQQFEDRQYYTAIRYVKIIGRCLPAAAVHDASQLVRSGQLPLAQILNMPATLCQQLQSRYDALLHIAVLKLLKFLCLPFLLLHTRLLICPSKEKWAQSGSCFSIHQDAHGKLQGCRPGENRCC